MAESIVGPGCQLHLYRLPDGRIERVKCNGMEIGSDIWSFLSSDPFVDEFRENFSGFVQKPDERYIQMAVRNDLDGAWVEDGSGGVSWLNQRPA